MVKRWGKSPPRAGQPERYGKPHPEQCRIGASRGVDPERDITAGTLQPRGPGWQLDRRGNTVGRGMVIQGSQDPGQNPAYRPSARLFFGRICKAKGRMSIFAKRKQRAGLSMQNTAGCVLLPVDSAPAIRKRQASRILRDGTPILLQEYRPWPNRQPSRSG
jgi:hypothetical protein